jgi:hypothetical protein
MSPRLDPFIGSRHGRLRVESFARRDNHRVALYLCECKCGGWTEARKYDLVRGHVVSCGCVQSEQGVAMGRARYRGGRKPRASKAKPKIRRPCDFCGQMMLAKPGQKYHPACQRMATGVRQRARKAERELAMLENLSAEKRRAK